MGIIRLTKGKSTLVDDDLLENLNRFKWYSQGPEFRPARRIRAPRNTIIYIYHQILEVWPWKLRAEHLEVDHVDRDPLNNLRENLRIVTRHQNMQNSSRSIFRKGVGRDNTHNTWKAYIDRPYRNRINIGTFKTYEEAAEAVRNWAP